MRGQGGAQWRRLGARPGRPSLIGRRRGVAALIGHDAEVWRRRSRLTALPHPTLVLALWVFLFRGQRDGETSLTARRAVRAARAAHILSITAAARRQAGNQGQGTGDRDTGGYVNRKHRSKF